MKPHPEAGVPLPLEERLDVPRLVAAYYDENPDPSTPGHRVAFGTSGHRGSPFRRTFNEAHIAAITQAVCDHRRAAGIAGPLFLGRDTHAASEPAWRTAIEVLAGNDVTVCIDDRDGYTPTPVVSHAILRHRQDHASLADGVVVTPSHNPPEDGGFKYNPPHGGPAGSDVTRAIEAQANRYLAASLEGVARTSFEAARARDNIRRHDYVGPYVEDLGNVIDMDAIRGAGLRLGADPMGGSGLAFWEPIATRYGLDIVVVNDAIDPSFSFMPRDRDGVVRMDCSSPFAMNHLITLKDRFDIAFGNDPDFDRHGIVTRGRGLLSPNHYLAVAIDYLLTHRPSWSRDIGVGKTLVSSAIIDRIAAAHGRPLIEVPVGFKWFVEGLGGGRLGFGGEESAGASFLRRDGTAWTTDKDGIILDLLAAEIAAVTGEDPGARYDELTRHHGAPVYARIDAPASEDQKQALRALTPERITTGRLAGDPIVSVIHRAPGNGAPIGGVKVTTAHGWFAARPSGTEAVYKIYAESFRDEAHLARIQSEAHAIVNAAWSR
ncbi:MAG: phosphoglucomutase (alpha-D-glucose-1,6-bisphosphate-dependent) [Myxococcota bacterium]